MLAFGESAVFERLRYVVPSALVAFIGVLSSDVLPRELTGGDKLKTPQVRSKTRRRVLDRVRDSIIDFAILDEYIDDRDIEDIFGPRDDWTDEAFRSGIEAMIAFLYRGAQRTDDELDFDRALIAGVHAAEQSQYEEPVIVNVYFKVDRQKRLTQMKR